MTAVPPAPAQGYVTLKDLAAELGMDRSHLRKWVRSHGLWPEKRRTPDSRGQLVLTLKAAEAEGVRGRRRQDGFLTVGKATPADTGLFYVIQLIPEFDPRRVKFGFATDVADRLAQHRTAAPTAVVLKCWSAHKSWESCATECIVGAGCRLVAGEVYQCDDVQIMLTRGDRFFNVMPHPAQRRPLADHSPHNA